MEKLCKNSTKYDHAKKEQKLKEHAQKLIMVGLIATYGCIMN